METSERIDAKRRELEEVFADLSDEQKKIAGDLIAQAAFLSVTLEDLNEQISAEGCVESYTNGKNQGGRKISSAAKAYTNLIGKYSAITSKLLQLAPAGRGAKRETPEDKLREYQEKREAEAEEFKKKNLHKEWIYRSKFLPAVAAGEAEADEFEEFYSDFCEARGIEPDGEDE